MLLTFHRSSLCTYIHKEHLDSSVNNISIARALSLKMKRGPAPPYCGQGLWSRKAGFRVITITRGRMLLHAKIDRDFARSHAKCLRAPRKFILVMYMYMHLGMYIK